MAVCRTVHTSVSSHLADRVSNGGLRSDTAQERIATRLSRLQNALVGYSNEPWVDFHDALEENERKQREEKQTMKASDGMSEESGDHDQEKTQPPQGNENSNRSEDTNVNDDIISQLPRIPRGLYVFGEVGTGKSMLMDMFYNEAPTNRKRRVHFHAFLQDVHRRIHELNQEDLRRKGRNFHVDTSMENNPIVRVAKELARNELTLLCLDEFQVTDVADAMILSQLFSTLFRHGTVVVATSNRRPTDLYEGGLNRSYFLPFIDLLQRHCIVHEIKSKTDYRRLLSVDAETFFVVDDSDGFVESKSTMDTLFDNLLEGHTPISITIETGFRREIVVQQAHPQGTVARFRFDELCRTNLASGDYHAIAQRFDVVLLEEIPLLTLKDHNEARRFITLVDELYEGRCLLACLAVQPAQHLFVDRSDLSVPGPNSIETKVGEAFGIDVAQGDDKTLGELASVRELRFAFRRAASRLQEMCSKPWWESSKGDGNSAQ